ncbi:glycosyl hydrolase family 47 protein [Talaromyces proteolyticus]|uniref:alpha-1,2-Mannosidase n=1 Tax=Talaromyces proteolyticus TaxID=1131652 RepID=A0AAD4KQ59_9EURO|nr:glycosyl hydrolase family 47 protein [Talaromyces proteolyticus]KAH8696646.1 glycosyl hydrolase family 47 protein [Talaromyces proteolyticus]
MNARLRRVLLISSTSALLSEPETNKLHTDPEVVEPTSPDESQNNYQNEDEIQKEYLWSTLPVRYPVSSMRPLPTQVPLELPKVQASHWGLSQTKSNVQRQRQKAVKQAFARCWESYKSRAWMMDEITPIGGSSTNWFGGWGATLVDSLDTLWIMDMRDEFREAVAAVVSIDFEHTTLGSVNVFETNIRYLGGFLAAYDLSGDSRLLKKAIEVGEMLYVAFDTPNRMPITRWDFKSAAENGEQIAEEGTLSAEIGSFTIEFTRLSQITGNPKWYDACQRIMEIFDRQQTDTKLPGMWPMVVNARKELFAEGDTFTLGAMADSLYEYLPKTYALLGGVFPMYQKLYEYSMDTAIKYNFYRPMIPNGEDILISGAVQVSEENGNQHITIDESGQHLVCFAGGMLALGGKLFGNQSHIKIAEKLTDGCIWTYNTMPLGIMPEVFNMIPCPDSSNCPWDEETWKQEVLKRSEQAQSGDLNKAQDIIDSQRLPPGFTKISDTRYILRPEAIESVFILYRVTGRDDLLDSAWAMFDTIQKHSKTELANAALSDITVTDGNPPKIDSMESFWMGETLKYFYLVFSDPSLISLDDFVFNTEAHPMRRPKAS